MVASCQVSLADLVSFSQFSKFQGVSSVTGEAGSLEVTFFLMCGFSLRLQREEGDGAWCPAGRLTSSLLKGGSLLELKRLGYVKDKALLCKTG